MTPKLISDLKGEEDPVLLECICERTFYFFLELQANVGVRVRVGVRVGVGWEWECDQRKKVNMYKVMREKKVSMHV